MGVADRQWVGRGLAGLDSRQSPSAGSVSHEDKPEVEFRKNSSAAKIDVWKPLVCREHTQWAQKPDRAGRSDSHPASELGHPQDLPQSPFSM